MRKEREEAETIKSEKEEAKKFAEEPEKEALERYRVVEEERKAKEDADKKFKEEEEAREAFQHLDNDGDGILTLEELRSRQTFDTNRDGQVTEEEARVSQVFSVHFSSSCCSISSSEESGCDLPYIKVEVKYREYPGKVDYLCS